MLRRVEVSQLVKLCLKNGCFSTRHYKLKTRLKNFKSEKVGAKTRIPGSMRTIAVTIGKNIMNFK